VVETGTPGTLTGVIAYTNHTHIHGLSLGQGHRHVRRDEAHRWIQLQLLWSDWLYVSATCNPRPANRHCIYVATAKVWSVSNMLPLYSQPILTRSCEQLNYHIIRLRLVVGVRALPVYSLFSGWIRSLQEHTWFLPPLSKKWHNGQETNSLCVNSIVNCLLCLLRNLPEVNCARLIYVWERKTYDLHYGEIHQISPDEPPSFRWMGSTTTMFTITKTTLPADKWPKGRPREQHVWHPGGQPVRAQAYQVIQDLVYAKDDAWSRANVQQCHSTEYSTMPAKSLTDRGQLGIPQIVCSTRSSENKNFRFDTSRTVLRGSERSWLLPQHVMI